MMSRWLSELSPVPQPMPGASWDVPMANWLRKKNFRMTCWCHQEVESCSATAPPRDNTEVQGERKSSSGQPTEQHMSTVLSERWPEAWLYTDSRVSQMVWLDGLGLGSWKFWELPSLEDGWQGNLGERYVCEPLGLWDTFASGQCPPKGIHCRGDSISRWTKWLALWRSVSSLPQTHSHSYFCSHVTFSVLSLHPLIPYPDWFPFFFTFITVTCTWSLLLSVRTTLCRSPSNPTWTQQPLLTDLMFILPLILHVATEMTFLE